MDEDKLKRYEKIEFLGEGQASEIYQNMTMIP